MTRSRARRAWRIEDERPEGLPPTPAGALTLGLRNFTNELKALVAYVRGDRSDELKGMEDETVRAFERRRSSAT